ncbi:uncharacterized protein BYT42DRAFT_490602 [Radiomyces spectabilis]|uniref:uncharacterized protein n=1 Tax=Radiomyces spectabilis TaxID=64574 RepID=UPI0022210C45|nr:uncharacterized protein BYT42DRAFT_490602 [Radiomyces spectabilis]KAI8391397.1 hypothetical protein BYT42DRAFT_490602 [Radiomyces spectabilis]
MTKQLRSQGIVDGRLKYNADGKIQLRGNGLELLLSEVSSSYGINDKGKTSFDHYKAMFGLLAMLRTIAAHHQYAEFATFSKFKVHFIHTHNRAIRHWTMFTPEPGLYVMNKEQKVDIVADFEQKETAIVPLINFTNTLAVSLVDTVDVLSTLAEEHGEVMKDTRFETQRRRPSLLQHIRPVIVRLNESKHTTDIADDGPKSPVYIPNH